MGDEAEYLYEKEVDEMANRYLRERETCSESTDRLRAKIENQRREICDLQRKIKRLQEERK